MTTYSGLFFFYVMGILLLPAVILGIFEKRIKWYGLFVTLVMLVILFGSSRRQSACLILFYLGELILSRVYLQIRKHYKKKWLLWSFVIASLVPLLLVKYSNAFKPSWSLGFLGISYLTFKAVQVIIEIHDGLIKEMSIFDFSYFLLFFPTITSGPIDRSRRFIKEINKKLTTKEYIEYLKKGIFKIFKGVSYKFIFAFLVNTYWMEKIPHAHTFLNTISYMYAYSFYLFFDFAGYSLMAIGTSYILGVATPENFNMPFLSRDIKDFWNRWHMTLSFWFRDFIYMRFVMSSIKAKRFKNRYTASYIGFFITMGTMGFWHGTELHYIVYGLFHALLLIFTDLFERKSKFYKANSKKEIFNIVSTFITFNIVCFGFLIFSGYLF